MKRKLNQPKQRPLILFITPWYPTRERPYWGIFVKRYAKSISNNYQVIVFHPVPVIGSSTKKTEIRSEDKIEVITLYYGVSNSSSIFKKIQNKIIEYKSEYSGIKNILKNYGHPSLVHLHVIYPTGWMALYMKYFYKIPYLITEHWTGYTTSSNKYKGKFRKFLTKKIVNNAKCITTVSNSLMNSMKRHGLQNNYLVIPNVIEIMEIVRINKNDKIKILTVANLKDKHKNISGLILAIKNISKIRNDFELKIVGDGEDKKILEDLVNSLKLTEFVHFTGPATDEELGGFYTDSDFFVLNSNYETFSVVTAEALGYGIPVIVTKSGGPEEFVKEEMGIIIEPKNQKNLEKAILTMMDNYKNYARKDLSHYAKSLFGPEIIGNTVSDLYQKNLPIK